MRHGYFACIVVSLCHCPLHVFHVQITELSPQTFFSDYAAVRKLEIRSGREVEPGPLRKIAAVGITGSSEVRPVLLHQVSNLFIRRCGPRWRTYAPNPLSERSKHVRDVRTVRCTPRFSARRRACEFVLEHSIT